MSVGNIPNWMDPDWSNGGASWRKMVNNHNKEANMKARLIIVPPGGGEAEYSFAFELPSVPHPGDYISVKRPDEDGTRDSIVRRTWWSLEHPSTASFEYADSPIYGTVKAFLFFKKIGQIKKRIISPVAQKILVNNTL